MQKVTGIGGVFFRSRDPEALVKWYEQNLGIDISQRTWVQQSGQTVFAPFAENSEYFGRMTQQWMICFRVVDLQLMIDQLRAGGIEVIQKEEWNSEVGTFARTHDPDGNPIELWQPSERSALIGG
ncbi:MAG TPA: VOC family protein [Kaistia sp.]|nr:VOC family protein [Kaistia sp.]